MPNLKNARLRVAAHYLGILDGLNDNYLDGGDEQSNSLRNFDLELLNVVSARDNIPEFFAKFDSNQELGESDRALLDICNAFPDAGSYLISMKMNAVDRIRWLNDALQASRRLGNDVTTQAHLGNLGLAYYELGEFSRAEEYFLQALDLAEQINDKHHQGAWLGDLGNIFAMLGDHKKAIEYHERHLHLAHEINDERGEGHALANLGVSYAYLGNVTQALDNYKCFLDLAIKRGDRREQSQALMNMGFAYYDIGNLEAANQSLQTALPITVEMKDKRTQGLVMGGIADICIDRREFQKAIQILDEALELFKDAIDVGAELRLLHSLGNVYNASDDYQSALMTYSHLYSTAEAVGARSFMCSALVNQTSVYRHLGSLETALEIGEKGLGVATEIGSLSDEAFARWQIGLIHEARDDMGRAIAEMERAIQIEIQIDSLQLERHQKYFEELISRR